MFISTQTPKQKGAIEIFKTLRIFIELRKRNAFDFLTSVVDLQKYAEQSNELEFNDNDFGFDLADTAELKDIQNWGDIRDDNIIGFNSEEEGISITIRAYL